MSKLFEKYGYGGYVAVLAAVSFLVRLVCASLIEFGNDEVYYRLYALFPDWSHFDHPGMVGWVIQLFTLNLTWDSELAIRMASVVIGTLNIFVVYRLTKELSDARTGWYGALLYVSSIYASVICGTFILPDTPQSLFWLLTMLYFVRAFFSQEESRKRRSILIAGVFCGLAVLSKYTSVFLWVGAGLYILFFDRQWLKKKELYLSILITAVFALPLAIWNIQNDFISLTFHSERVVSQNVLHPEYFGREIAGEFFYNNPVLFVLCVIAVVNAFRSRRATSLRPAAYLLFTALPLILIFWVVSWQRATLPHWSGPGFVTLIPLAAVWLCSRPSRKAVSWAWGAAIFTAVLLPVAVVEINYGPIPLDHHTEPDKMGKYDFTLDMYAWEQLEEEFADIKADAEADTSVQAAPQDPLFSFRWYPAANLDYYVARPLGMDLFCLGPLDQIHKYQWINEDRGGVQEGMDGWFIVSGRDYKDPSALYSPESDYCEYAFESIYPVDTVEIHRGGKHVYNFFVYRMEDLILKQ